MGSLQQGAFNAVRKCMKIQEKDRVVIVTDLETKKVSNSVKNECLQITDNVKEFVLEDFGSRPLKKLPKEIEEAVSDSTGVFYMATSKSGEKVSLRKPIIKLGIKKGREAHMPSITEKLMEQGVNTDYNEVKKISRKVYDVVSKCKEIRVTTLRGSDFTVSFNRDWKWIIADGDITNSATGWSNLPDGEVFTCPGNFNGRVIVDGCIGDYFIEYGKLKNHVVIEIKNCKVVNLECEDKVLEGKLREYIKQDENASRIGEFAIGTNIGLREIVGNLLQDEKFPGVHFAVGDSYPDETGAPFPSKAHCDFVILKTSIFVDGNMIMNNGKFVI